MDACNLLSRAKMKTDQIQKILLVISDRNTVKGENIFIVY